MSTEFEYKYFLDVKIAVDPRLIGLPQGTIRQGYLATSDSMNARVRNCIYANGNEEWIYTFKQKVTGRQVEIEQSLNTRDGMDLWEVADLKLKKTRHYYENKDRTVWEIDLFYSSDGLYMALAEIELPEGSPPPNELPELLQKHLLFEVPLTDDRFSNKRLGDVKYVQRLYEEIQGAHHGHNQEESV